MAIARAGRCPFPSGTHLRVEGPLYDHHAVVVASGNVVEYVSGVIRVTPYPHFAAGVRPQVVQSARVLPPDTVVHRAMFLVGERRYNVLTNNCEHFATWCTQGTARSEQVQVPVTWVGRAAAVALAPAWLAVNIAQGMGEEPWDAAQYCAHCDREHGWSSSAEVVLGERRDLVGGELRRQLEGLRREAPVAHAAAARAVTVRFRALQPALLVHMDALDACGPRRDANAFAEALQAVEHACVDLVYEPEPEDATRRAQEHRRFALAVEELTAQLCEHPDLIG